MNELDATYWEHRYENGETGWDIGFVSPPLKTYFDQIKNKHTKILIPGAGNAYEVSYLIEQGFSNVYLLDWAKLPLQGFKERYPDFPANHILCENFFNHSEKYDLIIEQTFLCSFNPEFRGDYFQKMYQLLNPGGKLVGVLFQIPLNNDKPPFGGDEKEYKTYIDKLFDVVVLETCYNSHPARQDNELFMILKKR